VKSFPFIEQLYSADCGPTCLKMIAKFYGQDIPLNLLRQQCSLTKQGCSLSNLSDCATEIGFNTITIKTSYDYIIDNHLYPAILHWDKNHFVVLISAFRKRDNRIVFKIADPGIGIVKLGIHEIKHCWLNHTSNNIKKGIVLYLCPTEQLYKSEHAQRPTHFIKIIPEIFKQLHNYRHFFIQIAIGTIGISLLQYSLPFLTQSIIDIGIEDSNLDFIFLILVSQLVVSISQLIWGCIRGWITIHFTTNMNIALVSNFLKKLMNLPLQYFQHKTIGDTMQHISDHGRVQICVSSTSIILLFSLLNILVFSLVLSLYDFKIFIILSIGHIINTIWSTSFFQLRKELDIRRFSQISGEQSAIIELMSGMPDIKLNNCEREKHKKWTSIQLQLYKLGIKGLTIGQIQQGGALFVTQATSIVIYFILAQEVISGAITLGVMIAITYIIGQLSAPAASLIGAIKQIQETKMSLERIREISEMPSEDDNIEQKKRLSNEPLDIRIINLSFSYSSNLNDCVLKDINLHIPYGKTTAIVGHSGCGKTTLIKLLLGFYTPTAGTIKIGDVDIHDINHHDWRKKVGAVLQDSFIFSDSIENNIALNEEQLDHRNLVKALELVNLKEFVDSLPLKEKTKIGRDGIGLSRGQLQRILISRAVYKNPPYVFLDEATNALDSKNEAYIMKNLLTFYNGRTMVVSAHRLSTIRNAHNIVVLENGRVKEMGTHSELVNKNGIYQDLIKTQIANI